MSEHGAMTWTGFILLNLRSREQYSEAFGSRNGGMMSQTIINISRYTLLHRVKRYRWFKKKRYITEMPVQCSVSTSDQFQCTSRFAY